jgi:glycine dehydrogenase subunit 1
MLEFLRLEEVEGLFEDIPAELRVNNPLDIPQSQSELEVLRELERTLEKNLTENKVISFLGGGTWSHFVPSVVDAVANRTEFLTSYTPYQPEINQGFLQALFEYQSLICELVDMEVANCSMYDWASSLGEAARMATRITGKTEFVVPHFIHPERLATLHSYAEPAGIRVVEVAQDVESGQLDLEDLKSKVSTESAAVYVENPSYLGFLVDRLKDIAEIAHQADALFVVGVDPMSLGVVKPPGSYGADIVIGEGQPLGNYVNFGGGVLGLFACRGDARFVRQIPGRVVGMTTTLNGEERGFCLALQTREQHIRREKATSNICTNGAHNALRAAIYLALMGGQGLKMVGHRILSLSQYAMKQLSRVRGVKAPLLDAVYFKEFPVSYSLEVSVDEVNRQLLTHNILGGKSLEGEFPELGTSALYFISELHTKEQIDALSESLETITEG